MKRFLPRSEEDWFFCGNTSSMSTLERSRCLRRSLVISMLLITMIPLGVTAGLSFFKYRNLLQEETYINARWSTENARQTIEAFLEKLEAAIIVVADAYSVQELADQQKIGQIFANLKGEHKGLVDLSLIGPNGIQVSYAGPYDLAGKDYSTSPWYTQALARKIYVSEDFMGFRKVPHFVIAVSKINTADNGYWLLRASIDIKTLDNFLASVNTEAIDDIFLVNKQGKLQSSSRRYGSIDQTVPFNVRPKMKGITMMLETVEGQPLIRSTGYVKGTPWILVLDQQSYLNRKTWLSFRNQLLLIFFACLAVASLAAYRIADFIAMSIRKSDESRDIMLQETERTDKLASIGRLAAGVAHEINNPLAIINEKVGLMKDLLQRMDDFTYKDKFLAQLNSLDKAVSRSKVITHRLLGFARRMEVSLEVLQVTDVIEEVLGFLEKEAGYRNITIEKYFQLDLPTILSDFGQLQQIFLNIINNAIDAVAERGEISISCQQTSKGAIQVDISDNGSGMSPEIIKNIFEPFFTTKKGTEKSGTGLGLSITYGLVKKLGGTISVHSEIGVGTTFSLIFPLSNN